MRKYFFLHAIVLFCSNFAPCISFFDDVYSILFPVTEEDQHRKKGYQYPEEEPKSVKPNSKEPSPRVVHSVMWTSLPVG